MTEESHMGKTWEDERDEALEREYGTVTASSKPPAHKTDPPREKKEPTFRPPDYGDRRPVDPIRYFGCNVAHDI